MTAKNSSRQLELYERASGCSRTEQCTIGKHSPDSGQQSHVLPGDFITSAHHKVHGGASIRAAGPLTFPPRRPIPEIPATIPSGLLAARGLGARACKR